jgi:hypothetical protein
MPRKLKEQDAVLVDKDIGLLKIQTYIDYCNSNFATESELTVGLYVAYYVLILGLFVQKTFDFLHYAVFLFFPLPIFMIFFGFIYKARDFRLARADLLIERLGRNEQIPSIQELLKPPSYREVLKQLRRS